MGKQMRKTIEVSEDAHKWLLENRGAGNVKELVDELIQTKKRASNENMKTAEVDSHGKASISRTVAGKIIEWRMKE